MMCITMNPKTSEGQRMKGSGPNPLHCPPILVHNQHKKVINKQRLGPDNSGTAGLAFNDFMQQPSNVEMGPAPAISQTSHFSFASNQQNVNLQGQLLTSLASQIMSQRSAMMNYDLCGNNPLLPRLDQHHHQNFQLGLNQGLLSLMNEKRANQGQLDLSQQSAFTRVPCQARGMCTDHNALTACLEVPTHATHGLHLMCSHPTCRSVGVKFRYCFYCKKPVTKQNFRSRHLHADPAEKERKAKATGSCKRPLLAPKANATTSSGEKATGSQMLCLPPISSPPSPASSVASFTSITGRNSAIQSLLGAVASLEPTYNKAESDGGRITPEDPSNRRLAWFSLLEERPADLTQLPAWIAKVISYSDPEKLRFEPKANVATSENWSQSESKWESLLWKRPNGNQDDEKVTAWLVKILEASTPGNSGNDVSTFSYEALSQRLNSPSAVDAVEKGAPPIPGAQASLQAYDNLEPVPKKRKSMTDVRKFSLDMRAFLPRLKF